ncbi:MAG: hypothetical protein IJE07_06505 [Clostridia bacterium]|nr:hypothetical protein [Clostridia bacterium]
MAYEYQTREEYSQLASILRKGGTRALVCFCVDVSQSMTYILAGQEHKIDQRRSGAASVVEGANAHIVVPKPGYTLENRIDKLNSILVEMLQRMKRNANLADGVVISVITFANEADMKYSFLDVALIDPKQYGKMTIARRADRTNAGQALQAALQQIEYTQKLFDDADVDLRTPTLVFLSDGEPSDTSAYNADVVTLDSGEVRNDANSMATEIRRRVNGRQLNVVPVMIGEGNAMADSFMRSLTPERTYRRMNTERDFEEVFDMIEQTLARYCVIPVADQNAHIEESVHVESRVAESVTNTNSTGSLVVSDDELASLFAGGPMDDLFGGSGGAPSDDDLFL